MRKGRRAVGNLKRWMLLLTAGCLLCIAAGGCDMAALSGGTKSDPEAETRKYNAYVEFLNFNSGWFGAVVSDYFRTFGVEEEPDLKEARDFNLNDDGEMYGMYSDDDEGARQYAGKAPDFGSADEKMLLYCDAYDALIQLYFQDVDQYYMNKTYGQDDFAGAKELHTKMLKAYGDWIKAGEDFYQAFSPIMLEKEGEELPELKEKGMDLHYTALKLVLDCRKIDQYFSSLTYEGKDFLEADLAVYQPMYDEFTADLEELKKLSSGQERLDREYTSMQQVFLLRMADTAGRMEENAADALEMIQAGDTDIKEPDGLVTTGGRNEPMNTFSRSLSSLIDEYNKTL